VSARNPGLEARGGCPGSEGVDVGSLGAVPKGSANETCAYGGRQPRNSLRGTTHGIPHANRFNGFCYCRLGWSASHG